MSLHEKIIAFKYCISRLRRERKIDSEEAAIEHWTRAGYELAFEKAYEPNKHHVQLYEEIMQIVHKID